MDADTKIEQDTIRKPPNAGKGRPAGSPNMTTALLKDAILRAAEKAGGGDIVEYPAEQAEKNPTLIYMDLTKVEDIHGD